MDLTPPPLPLGEEKSRSALLAVKEVTEDEMEFVLEQPKKEGGAGAGDSEAGDSFSSEQLQLFKDRQRSKRHSQAWLESIQNQDLFARLVQMMEELKKQPEGAKTLVSILKVFYPNQGNRPNSQMGGGSHTQFFKESGSPRRSGAGAGAGKPFFQTRKSLLNSPKGRARKSRLLGGGGRPAQQQNELTLQPGLTGMAEGDEESGSEMLASSTAGPQVLVRKDRGRDRDRDRDMSRLNDSSVGLMVLEHEEESGRRMLADNY